MSNTVLTPTVIANELLMRFMNNLGFAKNVDHEYDDKFAVEGAKIGDTFTLRKPVKFTAVDGPDITSSIQDVTEQSTTLVLNQYKTVPFKFGAKDLTLSIDRFSERYLKSAAVALANSVDVVALTAAYQASPNSVGTPGTVPASAKIYLQAGQRLDENAAPLDDQRYMVINPAAQTEIVDALKGLLNAPAQVSQQYVKGRMGVGLGFNWFMDQNIRTHTIGAWAGTVVTSAAVTTQGSTSIAISGLTAATAALKKGDIITVADTYDVNPVSGEALPNLKQFVLTADVSAVANAATLSVYPPCYSTGALKTVSAMPGNNKAVTIFGTSATATPQLLGFHKEAVVLGMAPLVMPDGVHFKSRATDPDTGMSIRIVGQYNVLTDEMVYRADVLFGVGIRKPEWLVRVCS